MGGRPLLFVALLFSGCNSILGNQDHHLKLDTSPAPCRLNSDCQSNGVCIFESCGPQCLGEADCAAGSRCLKTDMGTACVASSAATCAAGCPAGTVCSTTDGVCRNACGTDA